MTEQQPRGILRNKNEGQVITHEVLDQLDRQEVIKNTQLNARLSAEYSSRGDKIRAKIAEEKRRRSFGASASASEGEGEGEQEGSGDHLKWDEINLYKTEQEKAATMKIDEPKTPYEGGFNPAGEYYRDDDEDENEGNNEDDIPSFELGEGEYDKEHPVVGSLRGGEVIPQEPTEEGEADYEDDGEEEEEELTAEERHRRFEERRKAHYHLKGMVLKQKFAVSDEEIDNEDEINREEDEEDDEEEDQVVNK
ncbi:Protein GLC8 [Spathaspora sp. JA1]|nr:Protein GLC8 [Spathaspora sp. JA1]